MENKYQEVEMKILQRSSAKSKQTCKVVNNNSSSSVVALGHDFQPLMQGREELRILMFLSMYCVFSSWLRAMNNIIISKLGFSYPLTYLSCTLFLLSIITLLYSRLVGIDRSHITAMTMSEYFQKVVLLGVLHGTLLFGSLTAQKVFNGSIVEILKAATPMILFILLRYKEFSNPSKSGLMSVGIVSFGMLLSATGEAHENEMMIRGALCVGGNQFLEAMWLVSSQSLLKNDNFSIIEFLTTVPLVSGIYLFIAARLFEYSLEAEPERAKIAVENPYTFLIAGLLNSVVIVLNITAINHVGALTTKLLSIAGTSSLVMFNVFCMGELVPAMNFTGHAISFLGFLAYNTFRLRGLKNKK